MSTAELLTIAEIRERVVPVSVDHYHRLGELNLLPGATELIDGVVIEKMTKSPLHEYLAQRLHDWFHRHLPASYLARKEAPLTLATSEPGPDISVVRGVLEDFRHQHPDTAELVVEIAVSSLELDRAKAGIYAGAGVREYWIIDASRETVERYREPRDGAYRTVETGLTGLETMAGVLTLGELFRTRQV